MQLIEEKTKKQEVAKCDIRRSPLSLSDLAITNVLLEIFDLCNIIACGMNSRFYKEIFSQCLDSKMKQLSLLPKKIQQSIFQMIMHNAQKFMQHNTLNNSTGGVVENNNKPKQPNLDIDNMKYIIFSTPRCLYYFDLLNHSHLHTYENFILHKHGLMKFLEYCEFQQLQSYNSEYICKRNYLCYKCRENNDIEEKIIFYSFTNFKTFALNSLFVGGCKDYCKSRYYQPWCGFYD